MPMNAKQTRVLDPILTTVVQGYRQVGFVGEELFPRVPVGTSGGQILEFGKEAFMLYNTQRAPGSSTKRISFGYLGKPYALENHAIEGIVPREYQRDASVVPGVDLATRAINSVMRSILLPLEIAQARIATDANNYDNNHKKVLTGTAKWSHADSNPRADIEEAKDNIRKTIGMRPNVLLLSPDAYSCLKTHPALIEFYKHTTHDVITAAMLAVLLEIPKVIVGEAIKSTDKGVFSDIWGNNAILCYVAPGGSTAEEPSYGYTYTMEGHPLVEEPYWDDNTRSWIYGVTFERAPVLSGMDAGYLFQNPK